MRVLHCGNFGEQQLAEVFYSTDRKISNGLIRIGHDVYDFSYRYYAKMHTPAFLKFQRQNTAENALIEIVNNYAPNLLLLGKSENIGAKALRAIKLASPDIKIAMWWVDWIYNLGEIEDKLCLIDKIFITTDPIELSRVVRDKSIIDKCIYLPNFCDDSIDIYKGFESQVYMHDILFVGRPDVNRRQFVSALLSLQNKYDVGIYGQKNNLLLGNRYLEVISKSKITLNYSRNNNLSMYSSDRLVHIAANGSMVLSSDVPNLQNIFSKDEVIYFSTLQDMIDKLNYFLTHDDDRLKVAEAGWRRAHKDYNESLLASKMMDLIFNNQ